VPILANACPICRRTAKGGNSRPLPGNASVAEDRASNARGASDVIDRILAAAYPDAAPMTLSRLTSWAILREDHLDPIERDADGKLKTRKLSFWDDQGRIGSIEDSFIQYVQSSKIFLIRSIFPLLVIAVIASIAIGLGWRLWQVSADDYQAYSVNEMLFLDVAIGIGAICFTMRWLKVRLKLQLSMTHSDFGMYGAADGPDANVLRRLSAASGLDLSHEFELEFLTTYRGRRRIDDILATNRKLREGAIAAAGGRLERVNGTGFGVNYNPADVSVVHLRKSGGWTRAIVVLLYPIICIAPLTLLMGISYLFDLEDSAIMSLLLFLAGAFLFIWGILGPILFIAVEICRWLMGTRLSDLQLFSPLDRQVRIRSIGGRWTTLLNTNHPAVAVEVYNLISRDIRRPVD
jgi:hypothetical protein